VKIVVHSGAYAGRLRALAAAGRRLPTGLREHLHSGVERSSIPTALFIPGWRAKTHLWTRMAVPREHELLDRLSGCHVPDDGAGQLCVGQFPLRLLLGGLDGVCGAAGDGDDEFDVAGVGCCDVGEQQVAGLRLLGRDEGAGLHLFPAVRGTVTPTEW
jgi:hypothetical protein